MRYAKPVVENTSSRRRDNAVSSSTLGDGEDRADNDTIGSDKNDVDIVAIFTSQLS